MSEASPHPGPHPGPELVDRGLTPAQLLGRLLRRGRWVKAAKLWRACRRCLALS